MRQGLRRLNTALLLAWLSGVCLTTGSAAVLEVPAEYPTIQTAIDAAVPGDVVRVAPGTYHEVIDFLGKDILLTSSEGPDQTTIHGDFAGGSVVTFRNGETAAAGLNGFTITGGIGVVRGDNSRNGGGIYCLGSSPVITNNHIEFNSVTGDGGGLWCSQGAAPQVIGNQFSFNSAAAYRPEYSGFGGAIYCESSSPRIQDNLFEQNRLVWGIDSDGGAIACLAGSNPLISNNNFEWNSPRFASGAGGIVATGGSHPVILDNRFYKTISWAVSVEGVEDFVFAGNVIDGGGLRAVDCPGLRIEQCQFASCRFEIRRCGGAILSNVSATRFGAQTVDFASCDPPLQLSSVTFSDAPMFLVACDVVAVNSVFWSFRNNPPVVSGSTHRFTASYCNIKGGWPGIGNLDSDPRFVSSLEPDIRLRLDSPCIDAGFDAASTVPLVDLEGQPRRLPGRAGAPSVIDIGADEMSLPHAVRFGTIGADTGEFGLSPVLFVNGSAGDADRVVEIQSGEALRISTVAPAVAGPDPAAFVIYAWPGEPSIDSVREQIRGLGFTSFPTPLDGTSGGPAPLAIWNNLGVPGRLGEATLPSQPAPSVLLDHVAGLPPGSVFTLQGFMLDDRSGADVPASVTNAVVVRAR